LPEGADCAPFVVDEGGDAVVLCGGLLAEGAGTTIDMFDGPLVCCA